jgi:PUA domain protein
MSAASAKDYLSRSHAKLAMAILKVRRRSRLRRKEVADLVGRLAAEFGMAVPEDDVPFDEAEAGPHRLVFRGEEPIAMILTDAVAPTVRGLLAFPATKRAVTVDMGAVRFIYNGADVMAPGIVDADPTIRAGDIIWVRDEKNRRPLAVGRAIMDGPTMAREEKGKAIETLHHVGDEIWRLGEEET